MKMRFLWCDADLGIQWGILGGAFYNFLQQTSPQS